MTLATPSEIRDVTGITNDQKQAIRHFLQCAMYCWCKNRKDEWFSLRDLMGGDNFHWEGTPLYPLYQKHVEASNDPVKSAGKDGGWILKSVINDDQRQFDTREAHLIREYRWIEQQANA